SPDRKSKGAPIRSSRGRIFSINDSQQAGITHIFLLSTLCLGNDSQSIPAWTFSALRFNVAHA
ncbi:hypothetical protein, partial [Desulfovibrio sp.]|uniref:hypothetical protein n=1 Tax=Desulfovibrio sp. TaxID=885 RepID=UPI003FD87D41